MSSEKIVPTRMELQKKKGQISLARKGHGLLKKKRDALILEFFKILKKAQDLRALLYEKLKDARKSLFYASLFGSFVEIDVLAGINQSKFELEVKEKNVMGVKIPEISYTSRKLSEHPAFLSSAQLDKIAKSYGAIFEILLKVAEVETSVRRILKEIEKTKRRVNALEYIKIPELEMQMKVIKQRLEELERDSFVALKMLKKKSES